MPVPTSTTGERRARPTCPTSEIAKSSGMAIAERRDAPQMFTRRLKVNYLSVSRDDKRRAVWPLRANVVQEHPGEVSWAITADIARLWKLARP